MRYTFLVFCLLFTGCSKVMDVPPLDSVAQNTFLEYQSEHYAIGYPRTLKYRFDRSDGSVSISTTSGSAAYAAPQDYYLSFEEPQAACSPLATGISDDSTLVHLAGRGSWGKVDFYDVYWSGDFPQGFLDLCRPMLDPGVAYVFCAERDEETALIFRWNE